MGACIDPAEGGGEDRRKGGGATISDPASAAGSPPTRVGPRSILGDGRPNREPTVDAARAGGPALLEREQDSLYLNLPGSCSGSNSTPGSCTRRATSAIRSSSGSSSWPSSRGNLDEFFQVRVPACASRSKPARSLARPTAGRPRSSGRHPPTGAELVADHSASTSRRAARSRRRGHRAWSTTTPTPSTTTCPASGSSTRSSRS